MRRCLDRQGNGSGFTLLELLIVLTLIAVTLAIVVPDLRSSDQVRYNAELRSAVALLKQARRLAIVKGVETAVVLEGSAAGAEQAPEETAPAAMHWRSDTLRLAFQGEREEDPVGTARVELLFRPQGSSGGTVHFHGEDFHGRIHVDPINGRAHVTMPDEAADATN